MPAELTKIQQRIQAADLPDSVRQKVDSQIERLTRLSDKVYSVEIDRTVRWVDLVLSLPWRQRHSDRLDLDQAREILDRHHYGLEAVKERILEYLSVLKLKQKPTSHQSPTTSHHFRAPMLLLIGLVGTGKTSLAYSIAKALDRPLARIPFGGLGSVRDLRGQSRLHLEAEPGQIIKALRQTKVKNPVILLDELDRVAEEARANIMGVLVELLDPEQNRAFLDHYLDIPFDLSEVLFITTANNTGNIATAVMDRLEPINMPSYTDQDKIIIGRKYLLPQAVKAAGLPENALTIDKDVWPQIVRPLGYDAGIRTLQRTIQALARKTAKALVTGWRQSIHITQANLREFIETW